MEFELIIKGGTVVDGAKSKPARQDIGIRDGIIEAIGTIEGAAGRVIDATGRVVCPGFIDTHSHSDLVLFSDPVLQPKTFQGITTEVIGQDGMGVAPLSGKYIKAWKKSMSSLAGNCDVDWNWCSVSEYLKEVDKQALGRTSHFSHLTVTSECAQWAWITESLPLMNCAVWKNFLNSASKRALMECLPG